MNWIKNFAAFVRAALGRVIETSGLPDVWGWLVARATAPVWAKTTVSRLAVAVAALWRSFWAVWTNPATYPIIATVVFTAFVLGHHEGRRGLAEAKGLVMQAGKALGEAQATVAADTTEIARLNARVAELSKPSAVQPAVIEKRPDVHKARAKKPPQPAAPAAGGWSW